MTIPGVYGLWNLLWPVALIAGVIWLVRRYLAWERRSGLSPPQRRRIALAALLPLLAYFALRPAVPVRFAQYVWPPNIFSRTLYDLFSGGHSAGWEEITQESGLRFPQSARIRAADRHMWLSTEMRARIRIDTADVPKLIASRPEVVRVDGGAEPWTAWFGGGAAPLWWDPRPSQADEEWRGNTMLHAAHFLAVTVHHGWFGRSTVFIESSAD